MKTFLLFTIILFPGLFFNSAETEDMGKETLIDMINRADEIPVYLVSNQILYDQWVTKLVETQTKWYSTCEGIDESIPHPEAYNEGMTKLVSELNRVFKTEKFVLKDESLPASEKGGGGAAGLLGGKVASAIAPPLKNFDFSGNTAPFVVVTTMVSTYASKSLLTREDLPKIEMAEYKKNGIELADKIEVFLETYSNIRFISYDSKKGKTSYADPMIFNVETPADRENLFEISACPTSLSELTSQVDPADGAPLFINEITGMFDDFAAKHWKKQK